ncbi:MAG: amino acid adenylation domain-containing protein, partial [Planctomycetota bacterium]
MRESVPLSLDEATIASLAQLDRKLELPEGTSFGSALAVTLSRLCRVDPISIGFADAGVLNLAVDLDRPFRDFVAASARSVAPGSATAIHGLRGEHEAASPSFTAGWNCDRCDLNLCWDPICIEANGLARDAVERLARSLELVLSEAARAPDTKLGRLTLISDEERTVVLDEWNQTDTPWPEDACIHHLFEEHARRYPDQTAIVYEGRSWSYADALSESDRIAQELLRRVKPDDPVALLLDRSPETVFAIYGVLRAGGFYVPIDPAWPKARIEELLEDAQPRAILTSAEHREKIPRPWHDRSRVVAEIPKPESPTAPPTLSSNQAVYCLYTSGTTGKPKGVVVEHRGLVKRIQWFQDQYPLHQNSRVLGKTPYVFGISEWEFFWALPHGATLVIAGPEEHKHPEALHRLITRERITTSFFVPTMLALQLEFMESEPPEEPLATELFFTCGEPLTPELCTRFFQHFDARLINLYGPTEADMTYWECPKLGPEDRIAKVPIGVPTSNVRTYLLDEHLEPVPIGAPGELHFGGANTARGYLRRPDLNTEKFIENPFGPGRLYKTGDLARWLPDGNIEFLGRVDTQVKLRGYRIETEEIESVIRQFPDVSQSLVLVLGDGANEHLVAFVTPNSVDTQGLIDHCRRQLPEYMVPSGAVALKRFPMTDRQKVDRQALRKLKTRGAPASEGSEALVSDCERKIAEIWRDVLNLDRDVGRHEDFVSAGGSSLLAGYATTRIRKALGVELPGTALYTHPTIAQLAVLVEEAEPVTTSQRASEAAEQEWKGMSPTRPIALLVQLAGIVLHPMIGQVAYYLVAYLLAYSVSQRAGLWTLTFTIPAAMLFELIALAGVTLVLKRLLIGRLQPGRYPVFGGDYLRWWFVSGLVSNTSELIESFFGGTPVYAHWFRLLGARIGKNSQIHCELSCPDLISIGDDVVIDREAVVQPSTVENGELIIEAIDIADRCFVSPRAFLTPGTTLPEATFVDAMSTTTEGNTQVLGRAPDNSPRGPRTSHVALLGFPLLLFCYSLPLVPEIFILTWLHDALGAAAGGVKLLTFWIAVPFVYLLVLTEFFFLEVVLIKRLLIGKFRAGPRSFRPWDEFRHWLMERLVGSKIFQSAMEPWTNSELLSIKYRLLGAKIGKRVNIDYFDVVEFDLVSVGDHCIFGSSVTMIAMDHKEARPIRLDAYANVLDHCCLLPGVTVEEGALCGSSTLGPKGHRFVRDSISTGNQ